MTPPRPPAASRLPSAEKARVWLGCCLGSVLTRAGARAFEVKAEKYDPKDAHDPTGRRSLDVKPGRDAVGSSKGGPGGRAREAVRFRLARGNAPIPGYRDTWGTFDRDEALEQDHLQFFASGHPALPRPASSGGCWRR